MKKKRTWLVGTGVILLLVATVQVVLAASSVRYDTVGGVSVTSRKTITLSSSSWSTYLRSSAPQNINIIGYTYWTLAEYCPSTGTHGYYRRYNGDYDTNDSSYYTAAYINYVGCSSGISRHQSYGNHDFAHGSGHIYPYLAITVDR